MPSRFKTLSERIASKITIDPQTDCHLWQGSLSSQGRYPTIGQPGGGSPLYVHKLAAGPFPTEPPSDGYRYEVHHKCLTRRCVNPAHLQIVTHREHMAIHAEIRKADKRDEGR